MNKLCLSDSNCNNLYGINPVINGLPCIHENENKLTGRPIYYISDLHTEFKDKKGYDNLTSVQYINHAVAGMNGGDVFGDEPLLIAGDISCYSSEVDYFFSQLRMRREGLIIFVLGNHEIWNYDDHTNRKLSYIIERYRKICDKYGIILLHNELAFFYDDRTGNGELLPFLKKKIISNEELLSTDSYKLLEYSKQAKLIIYGGVGFSGYCSTKSPKGNIYNAESGLYRDIINTLEGDIEESKKCEKGYLKVLDALKDSQVIILTHTPFDNWSTLEYNPYFIYVNGHTHQNYFENTKEKTIYADNQVGYSDDCYKLNCFYVDGMYDVFKDYEDGVHKITYNQYIDFNIGKNIKIKKIDNLRQIYLIKKCGFYMFTYYNASNKLVLLNGGNAKRLSHDIDYYYKNLNIYGNFLNSTMEKYIFALKSVSANIKKIGGSGKIHGCIVDIDYYNHVYINPYDGRVVLYYALDMEQKYVYKDLETLLKDNCPRLLPNFKKWEKEEDDSFMLMPSSFEITNGTVLVTDKSIYKASKIIRNIQYLLFQNVVRDWNDKIIPQRATSTEEVFEEINKIYFDERIITKNNT